MRLNPGLADSRVQLGMILVAQGKLSEAIDNFREALKLKPDYADAHLNLGVALENQGKHDEAIVQIREAIRLKPEIAEAHRNLGITLARQGKPTEAIAEYHEAIRLKPAYAQAHYDLGFALQYTQRQLEGAIAAYREAIRLKPDYAEAHYNLGTIFCDHTHDLTASEAEFRAAIDLMPNYANAHTGLGNTLQAQGKLEDAVAELRTAIRLNPNLTHAHAILGFVLGKLGKIDDAIAANREALRLQPDFTTARRNLVYALRLQGDWAGALAELQRARELDSKRPGAGTFSASEIQQAERLMVLAGRVPALLKGDEQPANNIDRLALAQLAYDTKQFAAAARLWAGALAADVKLGDDRQATYRYDAACAAALAAGGQGKDVPRADGPAAAQLRAQALNCLKAERDAWTRVLASGTPQTRATVARTLQHWKADADLAGVREPEALLKIPEDERTSWRALWAEVDAILNRLKNDATR
jgi:tetratricopeptide (TPR) repeat protein